MKTRQIYYLIGIALIAFACDRGGAYYYCIKNESNNNIELCFRHNFDQNIYCHNISNGDSLVFDSIFTINGGRDYQNEFINRFFDTIYVNLSSNLVLKKDIKLRNNWSFNSINDGKVLLMNSKINTYSYSFTQKDFAKKIRQYSITEN